MKVTIIRCRDCSTKITETVTFTLPSTGKAYVGVALGDPADCPACRERLTRQIRRRLRKIRPPNNRQILARFERKVLLEQKAQLKAQKT